MAEQLPVPIRERVLEAAGICDDVLSKLLADAITVMQDKLTAQDTKFFSHQGEVIDTKHVAAHNVQLAAATELVKLTTAIAALKLKEAGSNAPQGPVAININVPGVESGEKVVKQVTEQLESIV